MVRPRARIITLTAAPDTPRQTLEQAVTSLGETASGRVLAAGTFFVHRGVLWGVESILPESPGRVGPKTEIKISLGTEAAFTKIEKRLQKDLSSFTLEEEEFSAPGSGDRPESSLSKPVPVKPRTGLSPQEYRERFPQKRKERSPLRDPDSIFYLRTIMGMSLCMMVSIGVAAAAFPHQPPSWGVFLLVVILLIFLFFECLLSKSRFRAGAVGTAAVFILLFPHGISLLVGTTYDVTGSILGMVITLILGPPVIGVPLGMLVWCLTRKLRREQR